MPKLGNLRWNVYVFVHACNSFHLHMCTHTQLLWTLSPALCDRAVALQSFCGWPLSHTLLLSQGIESVLVCLCIVLHVSSSELLQLTRYVLMSPDNCVYLFHSMNIIIRGNSSKILPVDQLSILVSWLIVHSHLFLHFPRYFVRKVTKSMTWNALPLLF